MFGRNSDAYYKKQLDKKQRTIDRLIAENNELREKLEKCNYDSIEKDYKLTEDTRNQYDILIDELKSLKEEYEDINRQMQREKTALINDLRSLEKLY